jgi:hypothetical protein
MKPNEGCGCQTGKVGPQFSGSTASKKQTFSRFVACWRCEGSLHEDKVLIRDIPEPVIKRSYAM